MATLISNKTCPVISEFLDHNPVTIVDVGCAGGIDPLFSDLSRQPWTYCAGFEASPAQYEKLPDLKGNTRTSFHQMAVHDNDGTIEFYEREGTSSVHRREDRERMYGEDYRKCVVPCATLATLRSNGVIGRTIDVLKLDVEGSELAVLNGAEHELRHEILCIKFEFSFHAGPGTNNFAEIHLKLMESGFRLMDMAIHNSPTAGLTGGDALYLKNPCHLMSEGHDAEELRTKLIKLAAISNALRYNEIIALISSVWEREREREREFSCRKMPNSTFFIQTTVTCQVSSRAHIKNFHCCCLPCRNWRREKVFTQNPFQD